jgi:hypothetical protein
MRENQPLRARKSLSSLPRHLFALEMYRTSHTLDRVEAADFQKGPSARHTREACMRENQLHCAQAACILREHVAFRDVLSQRYTRLTVTSRAPLPPSICLYT